MTIRTHPSVIQGKCDYCGAKSPESPCVACRALLDDDELTPRQLELLRTLAATPDQADVLGAVAKQIGISDRVARGRLTGLRALGYVATIGMREYVLTRAGRELLERADTDAGGASRAEAGGHFARNMPEAGRRNT